MLAAPMLLILAMTLGLIGVLSGYSAINWQQGERVGVRARHLHLLLLVQEKLSFERGPSNAALGSNLPLPDEIANRLGQVRHAADVALAKLRSAPGLPANTETGLATLADRVVGARSGIDALLRLPRLQRPEAEIGAAVGGLAGVIPILFPLVEDATADVVADEPTVGALLGAARTAADLREFAGLVGSQFTAPLTFKRRFTTQQVDTIRMLQGRVIELHRQLEAGARIAGTSDKVATAMKGMNLDYFGDMQALLNNVVTTGVETGDFALSPSSFAAVYVPAMGSIVKVRDALLAQADAVLEAMQTRRLWYLWETAAVGVFMGLAVMGALAMLRRRVILPLQSLVGQVIRLAEGDRDARPTEHSHIRELAELAAALNVLRTATQDADAAASRRRAMNEHTATGVRGIEPLLKQFEIRFAALAEALPPLIALLRLSHPYAGQLKMTETAAAAEAALQHGMGAMEAVRRSGLLLTGALRRLRKHCAEDDFQSGALQAEMSVMDDSARTALDAVASLPTLSLGAIRLLGVNAASEQNPEKQTVDIMQAVLAASEQLGAASGGLSGALDQVHAGMHRLTRLVESAPQPPTMAEVARVG